MRQGAGKIHARRARYGWVPWLPLLAVVFGLLAWDAWLNVRVRHTDYEFNLLSGERHRLIQELNEVRTREARLKNLDTLTARAAELGLRPPDPHQMEVVVLRDDRPLPVLMDAPLGTQIEIPGAAAMPETAAPAPKVNEVEIQAAPRGAVLAAAPVEPARPLPRTAEPQGAAPLLSPSAPEPAVVESLDMSLDAMMAAL